MHISKIDRAGNRNLVCWWMCRSSASKTRVATTDQLTIAWRVNVLQTVVMKQQKLC